MGDLSGPRTFQELPRFERGWTFLYVQQARIEREEHGIVILDERGIVPVPVAILSVLMLGPGTTVTHGAMEVLSENGCSVLWMGEGGVRFYAAGHADTERAANLQWQAKAWADEKRRMEVIRRMYAMRFREHVDPSLTLQQIRGREGVRVREAYALASRRTGVEWAGRSYDRGKWRNADAVNRALSAANACVYGLVHAAVAATGFSPGLGFIHDGKRLAFVYDIADLYKVELAVPIAFEVASQEGLDLEQRVRRAMRNAFYEEQLLTRLVPDIQRALGLRADPTRALVHEDGEGLSLGLWDPEHGLVVAGRNWSEETNRPAAVGVSPRGSNKSVDEASTK